MCAHMFPKSHFFPFLQRSSSGESKKGTGTHDLRACHAAAENFRGSQRPNDGRNTSRFKKKQVQIISHFSVLLVGLDPGQTVNYLFMLCKGHMSLDPSETLLYSKVILANSRELIILTIFPVYVVELRFTAVAYSNNINF